MGGGRVAALLRPFPGPRSFRPASFRPACLCPCFFLLYPSPCSEGEDGRGSLDGRGFLIPESSISGMPVFLVYWNSLPPGKEYQNRNAMKIITITGFKGGVGKSTTAIHVAAFFASHGPTLLVDGDPNHTAVAWANRGHLPFPVVTAQQSLKAVGGKDWVVFDTPARPNSEDLNELIDGCDLLILPTSPDIVSILPMMDTIKALGRANYRTLLTIVPPRPSRDGETAQGELQEAGYPIFDSMVRRSVAFTKAAVQGVTVRDLADPRLAAAWEDYQTLGEEIQEKLR